MVPEVPKGLEARHKEGGGWGQRQHYFCPGEEGEGGGVTWDEGSIFVPRIMGEGFWSLLGLSKKVYNESGNLWFSFIHSFINTDVSLDVA